MRYFKRRLRHINKRGIVIETLIIAISQLGTMGEKLAVSLLSLSNVI